jgi:glycosyltransferase involved in cell wall biosynthesis
VRGAAVRIVTYLPVLESFGGVELSILEVMRAMAARGHRISLFYEKDGNLSDEFAAFCETMNPGPSPLYSDRPFRDAARVGRRAVAASRRRPELIFANNFSELAWAAGVKALTRAPVVCHLHEFRAFRRSSLKLLARCVDRFLFNSDYMRRTWTNHGLDSSHVEVIRLGFSPSTYTAGSEADRLRTREALGIAPDAYVVVYLGRLTRQKGVDVLLEGWRSLALPPDRAQLLIVGLPPETNSYIDGLRAMTPPGCAWLPMQRDVLPILHASDVLALPSRSDEAFGRVVVEALATGRPAVASDVGGIPEILRNEFAGLLVPPGDPAALAGRLLALRDWRQSNPALAAQCAAHVAENFSFEAYITHLEEIFESSAAR